MEFDTANFVINDGQHRCAAIAAAIKQNPALAEDSISVLLFPYENLPRVQQMFSDSIGLGRKPANRWDILYDKDIMSSVTSKSVSKSPCSRTRLTKMRVLSCRSDPITCSALRRCMTPTRSYLVNEPKMPVFMNWQQRRLNIGRRSPRPRLLGGKVKSCGEMMAMDLRQPNTSSHAVVLRATGGIGSDLMKMPDWQTRVLHSCQRSIGRNPIVTGKTSASSPGLSSRTLGRVLRQKRIWAALGLTLTEPERKSLPQEAEVTENVDAVNVDSLELAFSVIDDLPRRPGQEPAAFVFSRRHCLVGP